MKYALSLVLVLTFSATSFIRADDPVAAKPLQPLAEEYLRRALDCLKAKRPDLKVEQLQLEGLSYNYYPKGSGRIDLPYTESVIVNFLDLSSRKELPKGGGYKMITLQHISVNFNNATSEPFIGGGTSNEMVR